jgi:hypothetical protein
MASCSFCYKMHAKLLYCSACAPSSPLKVGYCSKECQKKHWQEHKPQCKKGKGFKDLLNKDNSLFHAAIKNAKSKGVPPIMSCSLLPPLHCIMGYESFRSTNCHKDVITRNKEV